MTDNEVRKLARQRPDAWAEMVADYYNISIDDLKAGSRRKDLVSARWVLMYLLYSDSYSQVRIAEFLGFRDHGSVLHGLEQIAKNAKLQADAQYIKGVYVDVLEAKISRLRDEPRA